MRGARRAGSAGEFPCDAVGAGDRRSTAAAQFEETAEEAAWSRLAAGELHCWTDDDRAAAEAAPEDAAAAVALLRGTIERTARLAALWHAAGFAHGMLRSDNVALCGVALDLGGGARFVRGRDPGFNPTPKEPMYAFGQQPAALAVHMKQLATALSPLVPDTARLEAELRRFWPEYRRSLAAADAPPAAVAAAVAAGGTAGEAISRLVALASACCAGEHGAADQAREAAAAVLQGIPAMERIARRLQCVAE